jgi:hypothetical protein
MADILPPFNTPAVALTGPNAGRMDGAYYGAINRALVKVTAQVATLSGVVTAISDANGKLISSSSLVIDAAELRAISAINGVGLTVRDQLGNWYGRSFTDVANRITWTNRDGVAGPPAADIAATYVGQASITTLGTITTGAWNAGVIAAIYGGTGISSYTAGNYINALNATTLQQRTPAQVKADLALGSVDNTSDANKPVSTAQAAALNLKANLSGAAFTGAISSTTGSIVAGTELGIGTSGGAGPGTIFSNVNFGMLFTAKQLSPTVAEFMWRSSTNTECAQLSLTSLTPGADNTLTLGTAALRWKEVFAGIGAINTSDAREKTPAAPLTEAEIGAAKALAREIGTFQWLVSVAEKGAAARVHVGMTVQRCIEVMAAHGLDAMRYGFVCYDEWPERIEPAELDDEGAEVRPAVTHRAGNRYGFRMDQLMAFVARGLDARLAALEAR